MQILSFHSSSKWLSTKRVQADGSATKGDEERDPAKDEIKRVLSDCFRCSNLVVLTGLGTSLHVNATWGDDGIRKPLNGKRIAPTMGDLWAKAQAKSGTNFDKVIALSKFPKDDVKFAGNIEALLSYCKIGSEFTDTPKNKKIIIDFIADAQFLGDVSLIHSFTVQLFCLHFFRVSIINVASRPPIAFWRIGIGHHEWTGLV
jgi:hypothetical protein